MTDEDFFAHLLEGAPEPEPEAAAAVGAGPTVRDRVRGMLFGVALGDALGAPHEFRGQVPLARYTGTVVHPIRHLSRFKPPAVSALGQVTDDTEMTIALADAILASRGDYKAASAVEHYLAWANSPCPFMGRTTRALFRGVRTARGYRGRYADLHEGQAPEGYSASNGCLMRASPLAVLGDLGLAAADCALSNPNPVCVDAVRAYTRAGHLLLGGASAAAATEAAIAAAERPEVVAAVAAAGAGRGRAVDDPQTKGWVLHALHCAFFALNRPGSFQDRLDAAIRMGGDTDTNGAIAGALLGAQVGARAMLVESRTGPNLDRVLAVDPAAGGLPRPQRYAAGRLPDIADRLARLYPPPLPAA